MLCHSHLPFYINGFATVHCPLVIVQHRIHYPLSTINYQLSTIDSSTSTIQFIVRLFCEEQELPRRIFQLPTLKFDSPVQVLGEVHKPHSVPGLETCLQVGVERVQVWY